MYYCPPKITADKSGNLAESFYYLQRVPGLMLVKNLHSEFCAMSEHFTHLLGFQNANHYEGKSEYDVPCETQDLAHMFVQNDRHVIATGIESITPRQEECLFLLVRGKSVKEIGCIMNISDRIVEDHIAALRIHLDCATRSQMIEKAMAHDFLSFMSESFL